MCVQEEKKNELSNKSKQYPTNNKRFRQFINQDIHQVKVDQNIARNSKATDPLEACDTISAKSVHSDISEDIWTSNKQPDKRDLFSLKQTTNRNLMPRLIENG